MKGKYPISIYNAVCEFYALEAVSAMLANGQYNHFEPMRHSHDRWKCDFESFRSEYTKQLAAAIYDYTVKVVAGELRHCHSQSSAYLRGIYEDSSGDNRDYVYFNCRSYQPVNILKTGVILFDEVLVKWNVGFGGSPWREIAKAGLMKETACDTVFIDHCVDLSHNNSIYFDKGAGIFLSLSKPMELDYSDFLNMKRYCQPHHLIMLRQGYHFNRLLHRAHNLGIIEWQQTVLELGDSQWLDNNESTILSYESIQWGNDELKFSEGGSIYCKSRIRRRRRCSSYLAAA